MVFKFLCTQRVCDGDGEEDSVEIYLDDFENVFGENHLDTSDDLASMEDNEFQDNEEDCEILRDLTHQAIGSNENIVCTKSGAALIDFVNQTLPIITEHNRQLKKSGFERVLNTFDVNKIEEKVGNWLKQNNSLCASQKYIEPQNYDEQTGHYKYMPNKLHLNSCRKESSSKRDLRQTYNNNTDSDDSMHSVDTARYIRASRNSLHKNSSPSIAIKTYRMMKSRRQTLKSKYAFVMSDNDEEDARHLKTIRSKRNAAAAVSVTRSAYQRDWYDFRHALKTSANQNRYMTPQFESCSSSRRRMLKKRKMVYESSSSSDSDYGHKKIHSRKDLRNIKKSFWPAQHYHCSSEYKSRTLPVLKTATKSSVFKQLGYFSSSRRNRGRDHLYYYSNFKSNLHSSSCSSSSTSFSQCKDIVHYNDDIKSKFLRDPRPCKRESECLCRNDDQLCNNYK